MKHEHVPVLYNITHVMRLEIPMKDAVRMAEPDTSQNLLHERFDHGLGQADALIDVVAGLILVHEGLEIVRYEFKHQIQSTGLGLDDIQKLHNVGMIQFAQQRDFTNHVAWNAALGSLVGKWNALDGNLLVGCRSIATIDHTICSLSNYFGSGYWAFPILYVMNEEERSEGS